MGRGGGGGGRGGGGNRSLEQQLAGNRSIQDRNQIIRQASPSQLEAAVSRGTISGFEAASALIRRTEAVDAQALRRGDVVRAGVGDPVVVSSVTSTGAVRGRRLGANGEPTGALITTSLAGQYERFQTPGTARAFVRALNSATT